MSVRSTRAAVVARGRRRRSSRAVVSVVPIGAVAMSTMARTRAAGVVLAIVAIPLAVVAAVLVLAPLSLVAAVLVLAVPVLAVRTTVVTLTVAPTVTTAGVPVVVVVLLAGGHCYDLIVSDVKVIVKLLQINMF